MIGKDTKLMKSIIQMFLVVILLMSILIVGSIVQGCAMVSVNVVSDGSSIDTSSSLIRLREIK